MEKGQFLLPRLRETVIDLEVGQVRVRALARPHAVEIHGVKDLAEQERLSLLYGLVDPELTRDEVDQYYATADYGEVQTIVATIQDLSLQGKAGHKSGVPGVREGQ